MRLKLFLRFPHVSLFPKSWSFPQTAAEKRWFRAFALFCFVFSLNPASLALIRQVQQLELWTSPVLVLLVLLLRLLLLMLLQPGGTEPLAGQRCLHVLDLSSPQLPQGWTDQAPLIQIHCSFQLHEKHTKLKLIISILCFYIFMNKAEHSDGWRRVGVNAGQLKKSSREEQQELHWLDHESPKAARDQCSLDWPNSRKRERERDPLHTRAVTSILG